MFRYLIFSIFIVFINSFILSNNFNKKLNYIITSVMNEDDYMLPHIKEPFDTIMYFDLNNKYNGTKNNNKFLYDRSLEKDN